jgi:hypothetical protein
MRATLGPNVRPVKVAYFIDEDDLTSFEQIARFCCTQWGGLHSFIIPVEPRGVRSVFAHALSAHQPDLVVSACSRNAPEFERFCEDRMPANGALTWTLADFVEGAPTLLNAFVLGVEIAFNTALPQLDVPDVTGLEDDFLRACALAAFGAIWPSFDEAYEKAFQLANVDIYGNDGAFVMQQFRSDHRASPLNLTGIDVQFHGGTGSGFGWNYHVVVPVNTWDLCHFWCLRAISDVMQLAARDRRVLLVPPDQLRNESVRNQMLARMKTALAHPEWKSDLDIDFFTSEHGNGKVHHTIHESERLGQITRIPTTNLRSSHSSSSVEELKPSTRHVSAEPLTYVMNVFFRPPSSYREAINPAPAKIQEFQVGENLIYIPSNPRLPQNSGMIAMDLEGTLWEQFPKSPSVANRITSDSRFTHYGLTKLIWPAGSDRPWDFYLPNDVEAMQLFFSDKGYVTELGDISRLGKAVFTLMGGVEGCSLLRQRTVYDVIESLAVKSPAKQAQSVAKLLHGRIGNIEQKERDAIAEIVQEALSQADIMLTSTQSPSSLKQLRAEGPLKKRAPSDVLAILETLIERRSVLRGFHVQCPACGTRQWYPLSGSSDFVECSGCFDRHPMTAVVDGGERPVEYVLNTALNAAIDRDVLVGILLAASLARTGPVYGPVLGLNLHEKEQSALIGDFDLVYIRGREVFAAECKRGPRLDDKKIDIARRAHEIGCAGFHFASLEGFNQEAKSKIEQLSRELSRMSHFPITVWGPDQLLIPD